MGKLKARKEKNSVSCADAKRRLTKRGTGALTYKNQYRLLEAAP
jgi:hypothetical protein